MAKYANLKAVELTLPWPPTVLSPNARVHWAVKSKVVKKYRSDAYIACRYSEIVAPVTTGKIDLIIDFYPPRNGRYDLDNCLSRIKSGIDGISDYLGIDDCMYNYHLSIKGKETGGCVKIMITKGHKEELSND